MGEKANTNEPFEDSFCDLLGITFEEVSAGSATAKMAVTEDHLNFAGVLHGGAAFTLADATAGAAMLSSLDNQTSTALEANVSFLSRVEQGDVVISTAKLTHESRKTGEVTVRLETEEMEHVASYRCRGYKL